MNWFYAWILFQLVGWAICAVAAWIYTPNVNTTWCQYLQSYKPNDCPVLGGMTCEGHMLCRSTMPGERDVEGRLKPNYPIVYDDTIETVLYADNTVVEVVTRRGEPLGYVVPKANYICKDCGQTFNKPKNDWNPGFGNADECPFCQSWNYESIKR